MKSICSFLILFCSFKIFACDTNLIDKYQSPFGQFEIINFKDFSQLKIKNEKYVFYINPDCFKAGENNFKMPIDSYALTSATFVYMFSKYNKMNLIKYFLGRNYLWGDQQVIANVKDFSTEFPYEAFLKEKVGLLILYSDILNDLKIKKLRSLKIPYIVIDDYLSNDPLQRAEWNIVFGFLIGKFHESIKLYNDIKSNYNKLKIIRSNKIKVLIGNFQGAIWSSPGQLSYFGNLVKDAGGELIGSKMQKETVFIDKEKLYELKLKPNIWLTHNFWRNEQEILKDRNYSVITADRIFNNIAKMSVKTHANDFWQSGISRPDLMLEEYIEIFTNKDYLGKYWYKRIK